MNMNEDYPHPLGLKPITLENQARESVKRCLERYIDASDLANALELLGEICSEKAQHIQEAWQDTLTAKAWDKAAVVCFTAAAKPEIKVL